MLALWLVGLAGVDAARPDFEGLIDSSNIQVKNPRCKGGTWGTRLGI